MECFRKATNINSNDAEFQKYLAISLLLNGEDDTILLKESLAAVNKSLEICESAAVYSLKGDILYLLKMYENSVEAYEMSISK